LRPNICWATIHHEGVENVSSQMTFDAMMKAEMKSRWPDEARLAGNRVFNRCRSRRAQNRTVEGRRVRYKA
jgi:hypothetical protein